MKKQLIIAAIATLLSVVTVSAQGGGNFQRKTPEERLKATHEKLDSAFKPGVEKMKELDDIFLNYFKAQDKKMEEAMAGGGEMDRDAMRAERMKLTEERDTKLKAVLTEEQMTIWKEELEPSLRPKRGNKGKE